MAATNVESTVALVSGLERTRWVGAVNSVRALQLVVCDGIGRQDNQGVGPREWIAATHTHGPHRTGDRARREREAPLPLLVWSG